MGGTSWTVKCVQLIVSKVLITGYTLGSIPGEESNGAKDQARHSVEKTITQIKTNFFIQ